MSYYMMSKAAIHASRWCWQAYLGMNPAASDDEETFNNINDGLTLRQQVLRRGSNASEWEKSQWSKAPFSRLARVIEGIPSLQVSEKSPAFLIVVNEAGSLCSEGMELAKVLRETGLEYLYLNIAVSMLWAP
jgi:hypothetical protein